MLAGMRSFDNIFNYIINLKRSFVIYKALFQQIKYIFLLIICNCILANAQNKKFTVSGYILDNESNEVLISATVYDTISKSATISNKYGFFSITIPQNIVCLSISYTGYTNKLMSFKILNDTIINIGLASNNELNEITVNAYSSEALNTGIRSISLSIEEIKKIPLLAGESDILKSLHL